MDSYFCFYHKMADICTFVSPNNGIYWFLSPLKHGYLLMFTINVTYCAAIYLSLFFTTNYIKQCELLFVTTKEPLFGVLYHYNVTNKILPMCIVHARVSASHDL